MGKIVLSSLSLALGIAVSVYFMVSQWLYSERVHAKALRFCALGLFFMYWFQIPAILFSLKKAVVVSDFNLFFALTFPITFLAFIFIYLGLLEMFDIYMNRKDKTLIYLWMLSAIVFFAYHFIVRKGVIQTYSLPILGNLAFYVPIRLFILFMSVRWLSRLQTRNFYAILGASAIITEGLIGLARNFFIIKNIIQFPPGLWYVVIASSQFFFITQTISIVLLAVGFYCLHLYDRSKQQYT